MNAPLSPGPAGNDIQATGRGIVRARRRVWPAMVFTVAALAAVLIVLLLTGAARPEASSFQVTATPASRPVAVGEHATFRVMLSARGQFAGGVELETGALPTGITVVLSARTAALTAAHPTVWVTVTADVAAGTSEGTTAIALQARSGQRTQTVALMLKIAPPPAD